MHRFDYSFLKAGISGEILGISGIITDLQSREAVRATENPGVFQKLKQQAIIDSVRSSNAIEGIVTTKERYQAVLRENAPPASHSEMEMLGYQQALNEIYTAPELSLSDHLIRRFHSLILGPVSRSAGMYKSDNNWIQEMDEGGHISVRFVPVSAQETPQAMEQLLLAWRVARDDSVISPLLLIPCFIVDFLCIHPFSDGNGRVSRLLTSLLLHEAGYDVGRYISVDRKIQEFQYQYYQSLHAVSVGWHDNQNTYTSFIIYLLQILYQCYKEMDDRFLANQTKRMPKSKQIENLLMNTYVPISKESIAAKFPDISVTTIERVLNSMVKNGKVEKIGSYRNARYKVHF